MRRSNAPTLQTVADEAGVTAMMASVVLNGARSSTRVSDVTRARILEAATRLGYRRNAAALGLSRRRMDTLGVVAVIDGGEINLYFLEVLNGILEAAARHSQNTTVFSISDWKTDERRLLEFCDGRIDGFILIAPLLTDPVAQNLPHHTPFVTIHSNSPVPYAHNLDVDNEGGAYEIVRYLIAQGHRRIMHIAGSQDQSGAQQRLHGYTRALEEAGIPIEESLIVAGNFSVTLGRNRMQEWLDQYPSDPLPTAIFCASDAIAFGCMEVLANRGLRIPDDMSIVGFDDTLMALMTMPPLTTVRQPFRQMGRRAVELLLRPHHSNASPTTTGDTSLAATPLAIVDFRTEILAVDPVIRKSVGPPPERLIYPPSIGD